MCAAQLALALRHLHDRHIAYRDLKPENVCIDAKGEEGLMVDVATVMFDCDVVGGVGGWCWWLVVVVVGMAVVVVCC